MLLSLHDGLLKLRLESPTDSFAAYVARSLAFWHETEDRGEADLTVRFTDRLDLSPPPLLLDEGRGISGETFFIRDHDGSKASLPFHHPHGQREIVAERAFRPATLYVLAIEPFLELALLSQGCSFVHSSAFERDGRRILLAAAGHVGKTSFLLRALAAGALYLADDWSVLSADGDLLAYPRPLRLFEYNTEDLPAVRGRLPVGRRALHATVSAIRHGYGRLRSSNAFAHRLLGKLVDLAVQTSQVYVPAERLSSARAAPRGALSVACFMTSWDGGTLDLSPSSPERLARRIAASYAHEQSGFLDAYEQYAAMTGDDRALRTRVPSCIQGVVAAALQRATCFEASIPAGMPRDVTFSDLWQKLLPVASAPDR